MLIHQVWELLQPASHTLLPHSCRCWIPDYSLATCVPSISDERCLRARQLQDVFTKKTDCCDSMAKAGIWNATKTAQVRPGSGPGSVPCLLVASWMWLGLPTLCPSLLTAHAQTHTLLDLAE